MQGRRHQLSLSVRGRRCMRGGFGCLATTDGMEAGMSGYLDTGSIRRGAGLCGFPAAGLLAPEAMFMSQDIGGRRYCGFP